DRLGSEPQEISDVRAPAELADVERAPKPRRRNAGHPLRGPDGHVAGGIDGRQLGANSDPLSDRVGRPRLAVRAAGKDSLPGRIAIAARADAPQDAADVAQILVDRRGPLFCLATEGLFVPRVAEALERKIADRRNPRVGREPLPT